MTSAHAIVVHSRQYVDLLSAVDKSGHFQVYILFERNIVFGIPSKQMYKTFGVAKILNI